MKNNALICFSRPLLLFASCCTFLCYYLVACGVVLVLLFLVLYCRCASGFRGWSGKARAVRRVEGVNRVSLASSYVKAIVFIIFIVIITPYQYCLVFSIPWLICVHDGKITTRRYIWIRSISAIRLCLSLSCFTVNTFTVSFHFQVLLRSIRFCALIIFYQKIKYSCILHTINGPVHGIVIVSKLQKLYNEVCVMCFKSNPT